jgi:hypothetical protein
MVSRRQLLVGAAGALLLPRRAFGEFDPPAHWYYVDPTPAITDGGYYISIYLPVSHVVEDIVNVTIQQASVRGIEAAIGSLMG